MDLPLNNTEYKPWRSQGELFAESGSSIGSGARWTAPKRQRGRDRTPAGSGSGGGETSIRGSIVDAAITAAAQHEDRHRQDGEEAAFRINWACHE